MLTNPPKNLETLQRIAVAGIPFASTNLSEAVDLLLEEALNPTGFRGAVRFANAFCIAEASKDPRYKDLLLSSGINFPDGRPISIYMRRSKVPKSNLSEQIRGPSAFELALDMGQDRGARHFFLGATPETLNSLVENVKRKYPRAIVCGIHAPEFGPLDRNFIEGCVARIEKAKPNIVWVGLGTPKQDFASEELSSITGNICAGVGAAFDFTAGSKREAPSWVRKAGGEWAFRLVSEPRRLWKRYLFGNIRFLWVSEKTVWRNRI